KAGPPSAAYRLRKFARRHRRALVTTAAFIVLLATALMTGVVALGVIAWQREQARLAVALEQAETAKERDAKEEERNRAVAARNRTREALDAMVSDVTGESLATQTALSKEQKRFLQSVLSYYEEFAAEPGEDREGRERLASAHYRLGMIRARLGQPEEGAYAFRRSAELYDRLATDHPGDTLYRRGLAGSHNNRGNMLADLGRRAEAEDAIRAALTVMEAL